MAFASFLGRVLFASVFILSAYQEFNEFGIDGGPAAKALNPKFKVFTNHVHTTAGFQVPETEVRASSLSLPLKHMYLCKQYIFIMEY